MVTATMIAITITTRIAFIRFFPPENVTDRPKIWLGLYYGTFQIGAVNAEIPAQEAAHPDRQARVPGGLGIGGRMHSVVRKAFGSRHLQTFTLHLSLELFGR
jgi:hypothetical protein